MMFKHKATFIKRRICSFRVKSGEEKSDTGRLGHRAKNNKNKTKNRWKDQTEGPGSF